MPTPVDVLSILQNLIVGKHWKTSTTGYVVAFAILAYYFLAVWHRGETVDINWIMLALTAAGGGRALRDPRGTKRVKPPKPPATPSSAGSASNGTLLLIAGLCGLFVAISMTGCATPQMRWIQGKVDATAGKYPFAGQAIQAFRDAEGRVYVENGGYISTNGMTTISRAWAADEGRWITGRVQRVTVHTSVEDVLTGDALPAPAIEIHVPPDTPTNAAPAAKPPMQSGGTTADKVDRL